MFGSQPGSWDPSKIPKIHPRGHKVIKELYKLQNIYTKLYLFFLTFCPFLSNPECFHLIRPLKIAKIVGNH